MSTIKKDHYFVALYTSNPGGNSPDQVKEAYDYRIADSFYKHNKNSAYKLLYEYIKSRLQLNRTCKITTVSEDKNIMEHTTSAYNKSKEIKTIYLSNDPTIYVNDIFYLGIDSEIENDVEAKLLDNMNHTNSDSVSYYTLKKIKQLGFKTIIPLILDQFVNKKIHLIVDLGIFQPDFVPSVVRSDYYKNKSHNLLSFSDLQEFVEQLQCKVSYIDIVGFDSSIDDKAYRFTKITGNVCRYIIREIFTLKEKRLNVFTEDSKFLIFRPLNQEPYNKNINNSNVISEKPNDFDEIINSESDDEDFDEIVENVSNVDIGWYVLRSMTLKDREIFIDKIKDNIITIEYEQDGKMIDTYVTTTTMREQNEKSYYTANGIFDCCLFPQEKSLMVFELLNAQYDESIANLLKD